MDLIKEGGHEIGLHLENSRSFDTFTAEKHYLERHIGRQVNSFSKHGSRGIKYGYRHYAPYEPENYIGWARRAGMRIFFGNLEDPSLAPVNELPDFMAFPSAFWLEPAWRDTSTFSVDWLKSQAHSQDTVLLVHPENVLESPDLTKNFCELVSELETKIL
jgi:peptidoglycan/xylan/chitin deacetylase (PgdA/CDA1 family)